MDQVIGELAGRDDFYALDGPAEVRTEITFVACQEMHGMAGDGAAEARDVFRLQLDVELRNQCADHFEFCREAVKLGDEHWLLQREVAAGIFDGVGVGDALAVLGEDGEQGTDSAVRFGGRKEDVGVEKHPHRFDLSR